MTESVEEYHARVQKLRAELHAARRPPLATTLYNVIANVAVKRDGVYVLTPEALRLAVGEIEEAFNGKKFDGSA